MNQSLYSRFGPGDPYPELHEALDASMLERFYAARVDWAKRSWRARLRSPRAIVGAVGQAQQQVAGLVLEQLADEARRVGRQLRSQGLTLPHCGLAFALVRQAARLLLDKPHFDVQLMGGWLMLQGMVAEMDTGEGKTLTATLPAATAALAGWSVHIITVNDYLVQRDCALMRPIYAALGLSCAAVTSEMSHAERCLAYQCQIVYVSNKTVVFDYLRDHIVLGPGATPIQLLLRRIARPAKQSGGLLLHGLQFAIIDEVDSVLIDEARTPLIISAQSGSGEEEQLSRAALDLAQQLRLNSDYRVRRAERRVLLTEAGRAHLIDLCRARDGLWAIGLRREELALRALSALHLYQRDEHYLVRDGKVEVIDEFTGRVMPDRSWSQGLHQMIEVKEGCAVTTMRDTLASISYQRFFRRYIKLAGMTGTAREVRGELGSIYDLPVVRVPNHHRSRRVIRPAQVVPDHQQKWQRIIERVVALNQRGVPVLIGTRSVMQSEMAQRLLAQRGVAATVLNAKQDAHEAAIVAEAGQLAKITIATNMAGRGTDIMLSSVARELGGLHVILTERHEARRIDRQLAGRAARQGDPGSFEEILSLEDDLLAHVQGHLTTRLLRPLIKGEHWLARLARIALIHHAQAHTEQTNFRIRHQLLRADRMANDTLSFSGRTE